MALSIVLSINGKVPAWNEEIFISFDDDAEYWYLWPTMLTAIKNRTGQLIDLYDDAKFFGQNLDVLEIEIKKQLAILMGKKQAEWEVHTGTQTHPVKKEIYKKLVKKDIQNKLEKFLFITRLAREKSEKIICLGD